MTDNGDTMSISAYHRDDDTNDDHDLNDDPAISVPPPHRHLLPLLTRASPFTPADFIPDVETYDILANSTRILVVGAGGLGCELLKDLAYSGFIDIHIIDMDTIDISNLNRQFLFRHADIGKYKSDIAANVIRDKTGISIKSHTCAIQDKGSKFYSQFDVIIAGLDNIQARQWLNETIIDLVRFDSDNTVDMDSVIPLIDGGTEAFNGQARVFIPYKTSCFECSLQSLTPQVSYPMCTIRNVPRLPEHCIQYALKIEWPLLTSFESADVYTMKQRNLAEDDEVGENAVEEEVNADAGSVTLDKDNVHHMTWLYNRAKQRGEKYGINGVTFSLTMQVVKNIIPAIASTNALIAAACVNECFKYRTQCSRMLNNYYMYIGASAAVGVHTETMEYAKNDRCPVCHVPIFVMLQQTSTLQELIDMLSQQHDMSSPSLTFAGATLYMDKFKSMYADKLHKTMAELGVTANARVVATDKNGRTQKIVVQLDG